ncbi:8632_t:CDS:1 [Diversispora eburnea]|uniref:8632_t:CDS:1 n=1 Tax=Diversispora eburnea TaxID=1213867 RepID=A0A9N9AJD2_9GLOM|nr:8632_t:CDS:1 [Diversispora eburnea]
MNQKITFATILVAFSVFFICFTNASPIGLSPRSPGEIAYADFGPSDFTEPFFEDKRSDTDIVCGKVMFFELRCEVVRITGQFFGGFSDRTNKYEYQISGAEKKLIDSDLIYPPGTAPFQFDVKNKTMQDFCGKNLTIFCDDNVIGTSLIKQLVEPESEHE